MAINRTTILKGPAAAIFGDLKLYTVDDIIVNVRIEIFGTESSVNGTESQRYSNIITEVTLTPKGEWGHAKEIWEPFATPAIGASVFGSTDTDLVIHSTDGRKLTLKAAAITTLPEMHFSTVNALLGSLTFTALGANNTEWSAASKRIVEESAAFNVDAQDPDNVLTQPYAVAWGATAPYTGLQTEEGVRLSANLTLNPTVTDRDGIVDMTVENVEVMARFIPVGLTQAELLTMLKVQDSGVHRGASLGAVNSNTLLVTGTGVYAAVYGAAPTQGVYRYGRNLLRLGEVAFSAQRRYTAGALQPLYLLADAAPEE